MSDEQKRIIEAWGEYFDDVRDNLNKEGWYNGGNDKVQKTFGEIEITKMMYHQIPSILLKKETVVEKEVLEEAALEPTISKEKKKVVHSTKK